MNQNKRVTIIFLATLGAVILWFCYLIAKPFLKPVFFAVILGIVFQPLHARLQTVIRNRNMAALLSTLCALLAITIPALLLGAALRNELSSAYQSLSSSNEQAGGIIPNLLQQLERVRLWLGQYMDLSQVDLRTELITRMQQLSGFLLSYVAGVAGGITSFLVAAVTSFFTLFYLFRDGRTLWLRLVAYIPLSPRQLEKLTGGVIRTITASMYGVLAVAFTQGLLLGVAFWVLGLPSPVLWGMTAAIFSLIPLVGTGVVCVPAAIILIFNGHWVKGLILLGWGAGVVGTADNFIRPLVISDQIRLHPLYVFFALLGGVQAFGISGLFLGPMTFALAQAVFTLIKEEIHAPTDPPQEAAAHEI